MILTTFCGYSQRLLHPYTIYYINLNNISLLKPDPSGKIMQYPAHSHSLRQHTNQIETDEISNTPFKKKLKKKSNRNATTIIKQNKKQLTCNEFHLLHLIVLLSSHK